MGVQDMLNYALFTNPISAGTLQISKAAVNGLADCVGLKPKSAEVIKMVQPQPLWKLARETGPFIRVAAVSGAAVVILGAIDSHYRSKHKEVDEDQKRLFDIASKYHSMHTLALLGAPLCRYPLVAGTFFLSGIVLFCGPSYYYSFTGDKTYSKLNPIGGTCFILGWLGMLI